METQPKFCSVCGSAFAAESSFCPGCGRSISPEEHGGRRRVFAGAGLLLIICAFGYFVASDFLSIKPSADVATPPTHSSTVYAEPDPPIVDHTPQFGWVESPQASVTQVFEPGQAFVSGPLGTTDTDGPTVNGTTYLGSGSELQKIRLTVNAKSPVNFAMAPAPWRDNLVGDFATTIQQNIFTCIRQNILQASIECDLPAGQPMVWVLWDARQPSNAMDTLVKAGFAHLTGVQQPLEEQLVRNDVNIKLAGYGCIRNCQ